MTALSPSLPPTGYAAANRRKYAIILAGLLSWGIAFGLCWIYWPQPAPLPVRADRLTYAVELLGWVGGLVILQVISCFRLFDPGAVDPLAGTEGRKWKINQRALQNTVEQSWIFAPLLLALAIRLDPADLRILPIATGLWMAGRIFFWLAYRVEPLWRGPGFEWTLSSSLLLFGWLVATLI